MAGITLHVCTWTQQLASVYSTSGGSEMPPLAASAAQERPCTADLACVGLKKAYNSLNGQRTGEGGLKFQVMKSCYSKPAVHVKSDSCSSEISLLRRLIGDTQRVNSPRVGCCFSHLDSHARRQSHTNGLSAILLQHHG